VRDSQKAKLYAAERAMWYEDEETLVGDRYYSHPPIDFKTPRELQLFVNRVTATKFWKQCGGRTMVQAKANNRWINGARGREMQIEIPPWAMTKPTVLHELTHSLTYRVAGARTGAIHGPEFVLLLRRLIEEHLGDDERRQFDIKLEEQGVRWGIGSMPPGKLATGIGNST